MKTPNFQVSLPVMFIKENNQFVAYTPALDLSTCGDTFEQAQKRFAEAVQIFIAKCYSMGTLGEVLRDLGWKKNRNNWLPPTVVSQDSHLFNIPVTT